MDGVDLEMLRSAEERLAALRQMREAPIADTAFTPRLQTASDRRRLRQAGIELSRDFNSIGMGCLDTSTEVAFECMQNALFSAPRDEPLLVVSLSNLGVCSLRRAKPNVAIRYLRRAITVDEPLEPQFRARVRLNLCAALNQLGEHNEALAQAESAVTLLSQSMGGAGGAPDFATREVTDATCHGAWSSAEGKDGAKPSPVVSAAHEKQVMRAVALHNCCACYEHLGQYSFALQAARRALRIAATVDPLEEGLMKRLVAVEKAVAAK